MIRFKSVSRGYNGDKGERMNFKISNNAKKWNTASEKDKKQVLEMLDACILDIKKLKAEIERIP